MTSPLRLGVAGLGTVGSGLVRLMRQNAEQLADSTVRPIALSAVSARSRSKDRGVDIGAKVNIHNLILDLAAAGTAVIVVSSELEEVMALSHRILVMRLGRVVAEFPSPADREDIMSAAFL